MGVMGSFTSGVRTGLESRRSVEFDDLTIDESILMSTNSRILPSEYSLSS